MAKAGLAFIGTEDGLVLLSDPGGIGRWLRVGHELRGQAISAVWPEIDNPLVVLAATAGAGVQRSSDGGRGWQTVLEIEATSLAGSFVGTATGRVYRSGDAGEQWEPCPSPTAPGAAHVLIARADRLRLYLGLGNGQIWASADAGASWEPAGAALPAAIEGLVDSPGDASALIAVAGGQLYRRAGEGWETIVGAQPGRGQAVAALAGREETLLVGLAQGGIARSVDRGTSWTETTTDQPWTGVVRAIGAASYHMDTVFAGSASGQVAISTDRGRSWRMLRQDLPPVQAVAASRLA